MLFGCSLSQINHIVDGHLQCAVSSCLYAASGGQKSNCDSRNFVSHVTCYVGIGVRCYAILVLNTNLAKANTPGDVINSCLVFLAYSKFVTSWGLPFFF